MIITAYNKLHLIMIGFINFFKLLLVAVLKKCI